MPFSISWPNMVHGFAHAKSASEYQKPIRVAAGGQQRKIRVDMHDDKDGKVAHELITEFGGTDNVGRLRSAIATALAAARREGAEGERERCAAIPDEWAFSRYCSGHNDNPCCHVRTAATIAERIRALETAAKEKE